MKLKRREEEPFEIPLPYWLYVGGDDFRKNLPRLIEALALLKSSGGLDAPVVIACSIEAARRNDYVGDAAFGGHNHTASCGDQLTTSPGQDLPA